MFQKMWWNPKDFLYIFKKILHTHLIILGISNTPDKLD
jgi:hypothetical protein